MTNQKLRHPLLPPPLKIEKCFEQQKVSLDSQTSARVDFLSRRRRRLLFHGGSNFLSTSTPGLRCFYGTDTKGVDDGSSG